MVAPALAYLGGAAIGGLGGFLSAREQARAERARMEEQRRHDEARRARAREQFQGFGYTPFRQTYQPFELQAFVSPLQEQQQAVLAQFLGGELSPAQQAQLERQRILGHENIARMAAGRGMPGGAVGALAGQMGRDITLEAARMGDERQRFGLQAAVPFEQMWERRFIAPQEVARAERRAAHEFGLAEWLRQQQAEQRRRELLAQYA